MVKQIKTNYLYPIKRIKQRIHAQRVLGKQGGGTPNIFITDEARS